MVHDDIPFLPLQRPAPSVRVTLREGGEQIVECTRPLGDFGRHLLEYFDRAVEGQPDRVFMAQRGPEGAWIELTYAAAAERSNRIAQALLNRELIGRHVMILSENSLEHALLTIASMRVGAVVVPVSPAYSLLSTDLGKLRYIHALIEPRMVFAQNGKAYARALAALTLEGEEEIVCAGDPLHDFPEGLNVTAFESLEADAPSPDVEAAYLAQNRDTPGKILFTSGSTGEPKGVVNTQRMLAAVPAMRLEMSEPVDPDDPPVILDWLPWHHTFGGNTVVSHLIAAAGTLYIDAGKPTPELFASTIENLREVAPTQFSSVPAAFAMLAPVLEKDEALCKHFFSRLRSLGYGGAALPQDLFDRFQVLAVKTTGQRIQFNTGHGATETGGFDMAVYWETATTGELGLPAAGTSLKLVPFADKFELRLAGPSVLHEYFKDPEKTAQSIDEEGYFKIGDAVRWIDPDDPAQGLAFAGRVSEDFKLTTGTWVNAGALRVTLIASLSPLVQDLLLTGEDYLGALAWPNVAALRVLCPDLDADAPLEDLFAHPSVIEALRQGLGAHNAAHNASSTRIKRLMLMTEPPSIDAGEITDKRYVNQRVALERRKELVERLFTEPVGEGIVVG